MIWREVYKYRGGDLYLCTYLGNGPLNTNPGNLKFFFSTYQNQICSGRVSRTRSLRTLFYVFNTYFLFSLYLHVVFLYISHNRGKATGARAR